MPSLIAYRKAISALRTVELRLPYNPADPMQRTGQELCTLPDGRTVVCLFDGAALPDQPVEISASVEVLPSPLPADLRDAIKTASPHVARINERVQAAIAQRYSVADEIKLLRLGPSPEMDAYNAYVEDCRAAGRAEKAALGL